MKNTLLSAPFCLLLLGCRYDNIPPNSMRIFPNKVGDIWVYHVIDTAFSFQNPQALSQYDMTISVIGTKQIYGGINANVWVYNYSGVSDTNYVFQKADTFCFAKTRPNFEIIRQYVYPLKLHNSWPYVPNSLHTVAVDNSSDIVVEANEFKAAYHVFGYSGVPDEGSIIDEWIDPNVGVVKKYFSNFQRTTDPNQHSATWSLVSYSLK